MTANETYGKTTFAWGSPTSNLTSVGVPQAYVLVYSEEPPSSQTVSPQEEIVPRSATDLDAVFAVLAEPLEQETRVLSSPTLMLKHKSIAALRGLGVRNVIPRVLGRLDRNPVMWITLLKEFSGENPVPQRDWGNVDAMMDYWRQWGNAHGYT